MNNPDLTTVEGLIAYVGQLQDKLIATQNQLITAQQDQIATRQMLAIAISANGGTLEVSQREVVEAEKQVIVVTETETGYRFTTRKATP